MQVQISVYIRIDQAQKLEGEGNKSQVVRDALDLYYAKGEGQMKSIKVIILEANEDYTDKVDETMVAYRDNENDLINDAIAAAESRGYRVMLETEGGCNEHVNADGDEYVAITVWPEEEV